MMGDHQIVAQTPALDDYLRLRVAAGLSAKSLEQAQLGLPNTWFAVTVILQGRASKAIISALIDHLRANAPVCAYVSLIADGDAKHLYAKYGFEPVMPASIGMAMVLSRSS